MGRNHQRADGQNILLREISRSGPIPRVDLSRKTGISPATVSTLTGQLLRDGLILEIPREQDSGNKRGRPRVDLKINGAARLVAGIRLTSKVISLILIDFEGVKLCDLEIPCPPNALPYHTLCAFIQEALAKLMALIGKETHDLSAIGLGMAGMIDAQRGLVYWSPSLKERNINFSSELNIRIGVPVYLDNDANLAAMAEQTFGLGRNHSDFIVVTFERGIGMGLVLNGQLYRGSKGCGAEFGHTKIQLQGALCRCGQRGCLEAYIADYALIREADGIGLLPRNLTFNEKLNNLYEAAGQGNPTASTIIERARDLFAMGLANLINIFDPEVIILAGEKNRLDHFFPDRLIADVHALIVKIDKPPPEIKISQWNNLIWARGPAAYALDHMLTNS